MEKQTKINSEVLEIIVMKINGEIEPIGETNIDNERFANLIKLQDTLDWLLEEIYSLCDYNNNYEYSMQRAGKQATSWLYEKKKWLNNILTESDLGNDK